MFEKDSFEELIIKLKKFYTSEEITKMLEESIINEPPNKKEIELLKINAKGGLLSYETYIDNETNTSYTKTINLKPNIYAQKILDILAINWR